jgi:agmatine/peptidylarginine deiminase
MQQIFFPAEWHFQSGIQLTWPHIGTDWSDILDEVIECYLSISREIIKREKLLIVAPANTDVEQYFSDEEKKNIIFTVIESNDTWARDHSAISVFIDNKPTLLDFGFNGWGLKFASNHDNQINNRLFRLSVFNPDVEYKSYINFILEGGSIETDGKGTLLTTSQCLLAPNRNQPLSREQIEEQLKSVLGINRVLWLNYGFLAGDDTDSHIDTLARFCDEDTIAYVKCDDITDMHYFELRQMESELKSFVKSDGKPYNLLPLPMVDALYVNSVRLPATYANFLIINKAVLMPTYGTTKDEITKIQLQKQFPDREIVGIDCRPLIKQHGSLHCVTMQFPDGFIR